MRYYLPDESYHNSVAEAIELTFDDLPHPTPEDAADLAAWFEWSESEGYGDWPKRVVVVDDAGAEHPFEIDCKPGRAFVAAKTRRERGTDAPRRCSGTSSAVSGPWPKR